MSDIIVIPATYIDTPDAQLVVEPDRYGDTYSMTLLGANERVIAKASGFRPGAATDFGEGRERETAGCFGAFLAAALEDEEFATSWDVLADDADEWTDALALFGQDPHERIRELMVEIREAHERGRVPERQLNELASLQEEVSDEC